jgi:hypothetical protein
MTQSHLPLRLVLALVGLIHILIGLIGVIPGFPLSYALVFYGGALKFSSNIAYLLHIFGAYMLTIGVMCIYALWNPLKNKSIVHCIIFLLLFRGIQRIVYLRQVETVFGMVPQYYWIQTALFIIVAIALIWFRPRASRETKAR